MESEWYLLALAVDNGEAQSTKRVLTGFTERSRDIELAFHTHSGIMRMGGYMVILISISSTQQY